MKKAAIAVAAALTALTAFSCSVKTEPTTLAFFAMDTYMQIDIYDGDGFSAGVEKEARRLDALLSVTDPGSEIYDLNETGKAEVSADTEDVIRRALEICRMTDGALDVTVYPAVRAWGFTADEHRVPDANELEQIRKRIDFRAVETADAYVALPEGVRIDLGAVAKGYLGDRIAEKLKEAGVTSALVNLGGNITAVGVKPDGSAWRIAILDPAGDGTVGSVTVSDVSVVTSGNYERYFTDENGVKHGHIIDPATARPADSGILSATVVGKDGTLCDGLSTAIFVMGADRAEELWRGADGFEMIIVTDKGELIVTEGIEDSFTADGDCEYELRVIGR